MRSLRDLAGLVLAGFRRNRYAWRRAQKQELDWWRELGAVGYKGQTADAFISQRNRQDLLSELTFIEKPPSHWQDGTIVEFGSGPTGFVEYLEAKRKIAVEPLIDHCRKAFPHLADSDVEYWDCPAEQADRLPEAIADLVICFNMLDHTFDPPKVVANLARVAKPGADLFFQVNVYTTADELRAKDGVHGELHPHSFFPETMLDLLRTSGFDIHKHWCGEELTPCGEHHFLCAGIKQSS
jgi:SAM-dependent methyltransferase